ncbi:MAG: DNA mismatch repair protein MutS, partial [Clostridiales Family XIII bacterium]|nr:DNA mismatch repair protein MutS [Clostridiales Family XIII bacterium]
MIDRSAMTPVMKQYLDIKDEYMDSILFFRLGDFYEMFYEDAQVASKVLDIALTKKNFGKDNDLAPMCGIPYHSAEGYIKKLIENGLTIAVCEQVEDPKLAKGIVKREVVRIITPGTLSDASMLTPGSNNFLMSIFVRGEKAGLSMVDISTGELRATELKSAMLKEAILSEISKVSPKEIIASDEVYAFGIDTTIEEAFDIKPIRSNAKAKTAAMVTFALERLDAPNLKSLGLEESSIILPSLYALYQYIDETQKKELDYIKKLVVYTDDDKMQLDATAIRNLELLQTIYDRSEQGSLLSVIDKTQTAMGKRLLKSYITAPLIDVAEISRRQDAVEIIYDNPLLLNNLTENLKKIQDLMRYSARISYGNANARDLISLAESLRYIPEIISDLTPFEATLSYLYDRISDFSALIDKITLALVEDPPFSLREGGFINPGYSSDLDMMKDSISDGVAWIKGLEETERERTGIKTLKVRYNKVFGYYIDVTKANASQVPEDYIRKQTLVNSERYITPKLKEVESLVLGAESKIHKLEFDLFASLIEDISQYTAALTRAGLAIAKIDVLTSWARVSSEMSYVRPVVDNSDVIEIEAGRHPVIERNVTNQYIPNDIYLDQSDSSLLLITGPNMAGKSTYMRQTALIVVMAQMGCFVPARSAHIGVCDHVYTRIGASDNLYKGESTFFVEMNELSYILNTATAKSLIILDEIGRGTSTYDGLAIAWATAEKLTVGGLRCRTLLATHYHELTTLEKELHGMVNVRTSIAQSGEDIVFLHKIIPGATGKSYGIHVAKIAGIPKDVISSADK